MKKKIVVFALGWMMCWALVPVYGQQSQETISELGSVEEFQEWVQSDAVPFSTLNFVRRVGRIVGLDITSYYSIMTIDGELAYCIEPGIYAATNQEYTVDWGKISEETKQRLFRITNVGYGNFGHDGDEWFVATQLAVWRALGITHLSAQTMDREDWDLSSQIAEIEWMADNFGDTASFTGQTLNLDLGVPQTITDTRGVLSQFQVDSVPGVEIVQDQNQLTLTITSVNYQKSISDSKGLSTGGLVYVHPGKQTVYMVHRSAEPVSYQLNLALNTGNLVIEKQDESGNSASGTHVFELRDEHNELMEINDSSTLTVTDGKLELMDVLPSGTYHLKEVKTQYPYTLSNQILTFTVESNQDNHVIFVNELQTVPLRILKKDKETKELLDGAEFTVSVQKEGKWIEITRQEAESGVLELNQLKYGQTVQVCESVPPLGYTLSQQVCQIVELKPEENQVTEIEFLNDLREIELLITKTDQNTKEVLDGAEFTISVQQDSETWNDYLTSQTSEGVLKVDGLVYGQKVKVCEVKPPVGYELSDDPCQIIELETEESRMELSFENELKDVELHVLKVDEQTKEKLNGAEFSIYLQKENQWEEILRKQTGDSILQLPEEWKEKTVTLYADAEKMISLGTAQVDEKGCLEISALHTSGFLLIVDEAGNEFQTDIEDVQGKIVLDSLKYGQTVQVCEVKAPEGYENSEYPCQTITLTPEDHTVEITFENRLRQMDVMLYKVETGNEENRLNDALFTIEKISGRTREIEKMTGLTGRLMIEVNDEFGNPDSVLVQIYADEACIQLMNEIMSDEHGEVIMECELEDVYVRIEGQDEVTHYHVEQGGIYLGKLNYGDVLRVCEAAAPSGFHLQKECEQYEVKSEDQQIEFFFDNERIMTYDEVPQMGLD